MSDRFYLDIIGAPENLTSEKLVLPLDFDSEKVF